MECIQNSRLGADVSIYAMNPHFLLPVYSDDRELEMQPSAAQIACSDSRILDEPARHPGVCSKLWLQDRPELPSG